MIAVDPSGLMAILPGEPGAEAVMQVFDETRAMCISPGTSG